MKKYLILFLLVLVSLTGRCQIGQILYDTLSLTPAELDSSAHYVIAQPLDSTYFLSLISVGILFDQDTIETHGADLVWVEAAETSDQIRPWAPNSDLFWIVNIQAPPYYQTKIRGLNFASRPLSFITSMHSGRHGMGGAKVYVTYVQYKL